MWKGKGKGSLIKQILKGKVERPGGGCYGDNGGKGRGSEGRRTGYASGGSRGDEGGHGYGTIFEEDDGEGGYY